MKQEKCIREPRGYLRNVKNKKKMCVFPLHFETTLLGTWTGYGYSRVKARRNDLQVAVQIVQCESKQNVVVNRMSCVCVCVCVYVYLCKSYINTHISAEKVPFSVLKDPFM
jgi:hypothetical protein